MFPALTGGFLTPGIPGKLQVCYFFVGESPNGLRQSYNISVTYSNPEKVF